MRKRKRLTTKERNDLGNAILIILGILFVFNSDVVFYMIGIVLGVFLVLSLL